MDCPAESCTAVPLSCSVNVPFRTRRKWLSSGLLGPVPGLRPPGWTVACRAWIPGKPAGVRSRSRAPSGVVAGAAGTALGLAPTIALSAALGVVSTSVLLASPIRSMKQLPQQATPHDEPGNGPGLASAAVLPPSET